MSGHEASPQHPLGVPLIRFRFVRHKVSPRSRSATVALALVATVGAASWLTAPGALAGPGHSSVVATAPSPLSPDVQDMSVDAIYDAGSRVLAGGTFTTVQNRDSDVNIPRRFLFAFDKATGQVDTGFAPVLDGSVTAILAGPTSGQGDQ